MVQLEGLMKLLKVSHFTAVSLTYYYAVLKLFAHNLQWLFQLLYAISSQNVVNSNVKLFLKHVKQEQLISSTSHSHLLSGIRLLKTIGQILCLSSVSLCPLIF